jgi:hypothetical protein
MSADNGRILRFLLIADAILIAIAMAVTIFVDPQIVPSELKKYTELLSSDSDRAENIGTAVVIALIVGVNFIAIAGLWFRKRWARILYTVAFIFGLVVSALSTPDVRSGISTVVQDLDTAVTGAVLLLVWFIMKDEFTRRAS